MSGRVSEPVVTILPYYDKVEDIDGNEVRDLSDFIRKRLYKGRSSALKIAATG